MNFFTSSEKTPKTSTSLLINIGGEEFNIGTENLLKEPNSLLCQLYLGEIKEKTQDGIPFFDRDPESFQYIHNYLRGYRMEWSRLSLDRLKNIQDDAIYFKLESLSREISQYIKSYKEEEVKTEVDNQFSNLFALANVLSISMEKFGVSQQTKDVYDNLVKLFQEDQDAQKLLKDVLKTNFKDHKTNPDSTVFNKLVMMLVKQFAISWMTSNMTSSMNAGSKNTNQKETQS